MREGDTVRATRDIGRYVKEGEAGEVLDARATLGVGSFGLRVDFGEFNAIVQPDAVELVERAREPVVLELDGDTETTLAMFLEANYEGMSRQEHEALLALEVGDSLTFGGGAFAETQVERVE